MERPFADKRPIGPILSDSEKCIVSTEGNSISNSEFVGERPPSFEEAEKMSVEELEELERKEGGFGRWVTTKNVSLSNCEFEISSFTNANPSEEYESRYKYSLSKERNHAGVAWIYGDDDPMLGHLLVPEEFRGTNSSDILYLMFYSHVLATNSDMMSGSVGGGKRTANFFKKMGVPEDEIEIVERDGDSKSAIFETAVDKVGKTRSEVLLEVNGEVVNR